MLLRTASTYEIMNHDDAEVGDAQVGGEDGDIVMMPRMLTS